MKPNLYQFDPFLESARKRGSHIKSGSSEPQYFFEESNNEADDVMESEWEPVNVQAKAAEVPEASEFTEIWKKALDFPDVVIGSKPAQTKRATCVPIPRDDQARFTKKGYQPKRKQSVPLEVSLTTFSPSMEEEELAEAATPADMEDFDEVKESLKILRSPGKTAVFAVVIDREVPENNVVSALKCYGTTAFGGYVHDRSRDSYLAECVTCTFLGYVPFSLVLRMPNVGSWEINIPISDKVLEKHFTPKQIKLLNECREKYPKSRYTINFVQMLSCR